MKSVKQQEMKEIIVEKISTQAKINDLQKQIDDLQPLIHQYKSASKDSQMKTIEKQFNSEVTSIRKKLLSLKVIVVNEHGRRKLKNIIDALYVKTDKFKEIYKQRFKSILDINVDDGVHHNVDLGQATTQVLQKDNTYLKGIVLSIEDRYDEIRQLETQVLEIAELFKDLALLVDRQQESLDVIALHVVKAKNHAENGEVNLQDAEKYQKKSRNVMCYCMMCLLMVCAIIVLSVLGAKSKL